MELNYLAIGVAALSYFALGAIWYSKLMFGNAWLKGIGKTEEEAMKDHSPMNYVIGFLCAFVASYGIARVMYWAGKTTVQDGLMVGFFLSTCLVFTAFVMNNAFERRPNSLTLINTGYHIVGFVIAGMIIGAMGACSV